MINRLQKLKKYENFIFNKICEFSNKSFAFASESK